MLHSFTFTSTQTFRSQYRSTVSYDPVILLNQGHRGRCSLFTWWTGCWSITGHTHTILSLYFSNQGNDGVTQSQECGRKPEKPEHANTTERERPELESNLQPVAQYCSLNTSNTAAAQKKELKMKIIMRMRKYDTVQRSAFVLLRL